MPEQNPYSHKDFTNHDLSDRLDMDNLIIENSCFSQERPKSKIFPPSLRGVTFIDCNLDNCEISPDNHAINCSRKSFQVQNDGEDWHIDPNTLQPLAPLNDKEFAKYGLSINPLDISPIRLEKSIIQLKIEELNIQRAQVVDQAAKDFDAIHIIEAVSATIATAPIISGGII